MQVMIDIDEDAYNTLKSYTGNLTYSEYLIKNGTLQPKAGHWIRTVDKAEYLVWECNCGWQQRFATNYCPNCGARMTESEEKK